MPRTGLTAAEIRSRAIEVALELIRAHGFEKVRLTDVARELGVSHVALYAHFVNREALLDAVLEAWLAEVATTLDAVCAASGAPLPKIERWFLEQYAMKRERALNDGATYAAFDTATAAHKPFVKRHLEHRARQLTGLLQEAGAASPKRQAAVLLDGTHGFFHPRLVLESAQTNREPELKRVLQALLRGLGLQK